MPVYQLIDQLVFPPPELAEPGGLLAVGGDLSPERLLLAYSMGIFPWYNPGEPILWWSPDPRCILEPQTLRVSKSLAKVLRRHSFDVTFDQDFPAVIEACAESRRSREGTWITPEMQKAYCRLHELGFAHSVECWQDGMLVGGLYGVSLGSCFFGESMFHRVTDASKVALVHLLGDRNGRHFTLVDCQLSTPHLVSLGALEVARAEYLTRLKAAGISPSLRPSPTPFP